MAVPARPLRHRRTRVSGLTGADDPNRHGVCHPPVGGRPGAAGPLTDHRNDSGNCDCLTVGPKFTDDLGHLVWRRSLHVFLQFCLRDAPPGCGAQRARERARDGPPRPSSEPTPTNAQTKIRRQVRDLSTGRIWPARLEVRRSVHNHHGGNARELAAVSFSGRTLEMNLMVTPPPPPSPEPWPISLLTRAANSRLGITVLVRARARRNS
jgi:hypothetical protein